MSEIKSTTRGHDVVQVKILEPGITSRSTVPMER